jgi:hypothetical protein
LIYVRSIALTIMFFLVIQITPAFAQVRQSPTPIIVNLITPTPFNRQQSVATVTSTFTPTPKGPVLLEARESSGNVNVRAEPDPDGDRLGSISFGTQYPVLRQFFSWYELQYDLSPSGRAWIYGELVDIIGDASEIEVVDTLEIASAQSISDLRSTETWIAITSAPGGGQTATANARVLGVPTIIDGENVVVDLVVTPLPTFTYPSDIIAIAPTQSNFLAGETNGQKQKAPASQIPPLLPIVILGGFGIIGLLINSLRR